MKIKKITLAYFSPTKTTQKVLESIAKGFAVEDIGHIDMTLPDSDSKEIPLSADELVIMGVPVYGGRVPAVAIDRFRKLKANNTLAVPVVVYGNRAFEDALLELKNLAVEWGFVPVAGGAFIGEHSFATKDINIANGRPDDADVQEAMDFGAKINDKIAALPSADANKELNVSGRFPYVAAGPIAMDISPVTKEDTCTVCGTCAEVCPTAAITVNGSVATKTDQCIRCCACIKNCPTGARHWENEMMVKIANGLSMYFKYPNEPRIFGVDV